MKLKQATRLTLVEQIVSQMEALIQTGEWPVGKRIPPEPDLVTQLGVSRNTVREAVRALIHAGLLEARQGDGTYVISSSDLGAAFLRHLRRARVEETLEVRYSLEREAARLAALRRTDEDIEKLRSLIQQMIRTEDQDPDAYLQADVELHQAIVAATHNRVLIDLYKHMSDALRASIGVVIHRISLTKTHCELVEAIIAQDAESAEKAARTYIELAQSSLRQKCEKEGLQ